MVARAGFYALALSAALVMASGAMLSGDAMAQAEDVTVQAEEVGQPVPKQKPAVAERPVKADLDQSAVRAATVRSSPRPTRTSTRAIAVPKILGSYR